MTAVAEDTDLSWVTFTEDDHAEPCSGDRMPCSHEAVAVGIWHRPCNCDSSRTYHCVHHRDIVVKADARWPHEWQCAVCRAKVTLLRMVPLR